MHWLFVADLERPELSEQDEHHVVRVLRVRPGESLMVSDGAGGSRPCSFRPGGGLEPSAEVVRVARPHPEVGVGFALVKGDRPELVVQKLTELGIDAILPFVADRSVVRWDAERTAKAHTRLTRVAREAAMQSQRCWLPTLDPVVEFRVLAQRPGVARAERGGGPVGLTCPIWLVGPEGGWSDEERATDLPSVGLADSVLRAETAAISAGLLLVSLRSGRVRPA